MIQLNKVKLGSTISRCFDGRIGKIVGFEGLCYVTIEWCDNDELEYVVHVKSIDLEKY